MTNEMYRNDLFLVTVIGGLVGFLAQPIIGNLIPESNLSLRVGIFLGFLVLAPLALSIGNLFGKIHPIAYQFAQFAAVGTLNSFIDVGILNFTIALTNIASGPAFPLMKAASFFIATTNSYFWNKYWTFRASRRPNPREVTQFYAVAIAGGILNVAAASLVVNFWPRPPAISPNLWANLGALAGILSALLWDFVGYKYFVFDQVSMGDKNPGIDSLGPPGI